jgi:Icc-related predicted phosphoesterase
MTGKAMVPIVSSNGGWEVTLQDQRHVLTTEEEVRSVEKRISDRGYYPIRLTPEEVAAWNADSSLVDARFKAEMLGNVERWMALADERLEGKGIRCVVSPANDDMFEIDPIIASAKNVELGEANTIPLDGFTLVSTGWANTTPWHTYRELEEPELRERIDSLVADVSDPKRAIFNFHAPPYGSNLDNAPKLDADMKYVSGGQALIPETLSKVRELRRRISRINPACELEVDGGIYPENVAQVLSAGAHVIVAGSAVFGKGDIAEAARRFKQIFEGYGPVK